TELDDKPREKVFVEKLRPGSRKLESMINGDKISTEDDGLRAVDVNDRVAVVKRSKNITIVFDQGK
ncbi:16485_t:CDS:2, partial [Gigaspora rosea]